MQTLLLLLLINIIFFGLHNKLKIRINLFLLQNYLLISQVVKIEAVDMNVLRLSLHIYKTTPFSYCKRLFRHHKFGRPVSLHPGAKMTVPEKGKKELYTDKSL